MSDTPEVPSVVIAADDPLLTAFTMQHDLRERFLHALEQVQAVLRSFDPEIAADAETMSAALTNIEEIVDEALDQQAIQGWMDNGRPLPWLDERLGEGPERVRDAVLKMIGLEDS